MPPRGREVQAQVPSAQVPCHGERIYSSMMALRACVPSCVLWSHYDRLEKSIQMSQRRPPTRWDLYDDLSRLDVCYVGGHERGRGCEGR